MADITASLLPCSLALVPKGALTPYVDHGRQLRQPNPR
jgi:hypothetical protein